MSLCAVSEREAHKHVTHMRVRYQGYETPALQAYREEQAWHAAGEHAIRLEMERRLHMRGWTAEPPTEVH